MRTRIVVGDVFEVALGSGRVGFFQYIARDLSQLNSHVVRVFKETRSACEAFDANQITQGDIDFHAHVFINVGIKLQAWRKLARADIVKSQEVLFRDSSDYGKSKNKTSDNWLVWSIDGPRVAVGALKGSNRRAEVGVVVPPVSLIYRMNNGVYDFYYPEPGP